MKRQIFYSWQSDLTSSTNRGFIEDCLKRAIKNLNREYLYNIEFNLDRDTEDETGTPDIVNTIFKKIEKSAIFVADISIISDQNAAGRKTPNPNVLIELGYAAKTLGWERIICFYNLDKGKIEELPFDLRFRRPLTYYLENEESDEVRNNIVKQLEYAILEIDKTTNLNNEIFEYVKMKIDTEVLGLLNILLKIIFGYSHPRMRKLEDYVEFLNISDSALRQRLTEQKFIGFQIFKNFDHLRKKFEQLLENPLVLNSLGTPQLNPLVNYLANLIRYENIQSWRHISDMYLALGGKANGFWLQKASIIHPTNDENAFLLIRTIADGHGEVVDFGNFREKDKIDNLLSYFKINIKHLDLYVSTLREFIKTTGNWLDHTGGEFIIDNKIHKFSSSIDISKL